MAEAIKQFFTETFTNPYFGGVIISMLPIVELRGGLPYIFIRLGADGYLNLLYSFLAAFAGSSLMCPILLAFFIPVLNFMKRTRVFKKLAYKIEGHFKKKSNKLADNPPEGTLQAGIAAEGAHLSDETTTVIVETLPEQAVVSAPSDENAVAAEQKRQKKVSKIKYWGLFVFTAIPLPFTGVWTASAVAAVLNLDFKKSLFFIVLGNFVAGLLVSLICLIFGVYVF